MGSLTWGPPRGGWPSFTKSGAVVRRCYLAGPIRGDNGYAEKFRAGKATLESKGWEVWSPLDWIERTQQVPGDKHDDRQGMSDDIAALVWCDAVMMLPGWHSSPGAKAEVAVAHAVNIPVYEPGEWPNA